MYYRYILNGAVFVPPNLKMELIKVDTLVVRLSSAIHSEEIDPVFPKLLNYYLILFMLSLKSWVN